jgi:hypothetical protein
MIQPASNCQILKSWKPPGRALEMVLGGEKARHHNCQREPRPSAWQDNTATVEATRVSTNMASKKKGKHSESNFGIKIAFWI